MDNLTKRLLFKQPTLRNSMRTFLKDTQGVHGLKPSHLNNDTYQL